MAPVSYTVFPWSVNTARITLGKFDMATDTWTPAVESGPLLTFDSVFRLLKIERRGGSFAIAYTDDDKAVSVWDVGGSARRVSPLPGVDGILANVLQAMAVDASDVVHIAYGAKTRLAAGNASCSVEYASQEMDGTTTHVQMIPGYDEGSALGSIGWAGGVISGVPWFSTSEYDLIEYNPHYRLASPGLALVNPAEDADYTVDVDGVAGVMRNDGKYYAGVQAIMPGASYPGKTFVVPYDGSVLGGRIILQDTLASRYTTQMLMGAGADGDIGIVTRGTPGYKWMFWRIKGEAAGCPNWAT
jgi:hypothetical protein